MVRCTCQGKSLIFDAAQGKDWREYKLNFSVGGLQHMWMLLLVKPSHCVASNFDLIVVCLCPFIGM
jgi:hypothetical protein